MGFLDVVTAEKLWGRVNRRGEDECWFWAYGTVHGYGTMVLPGMRGRTGLAHRLAYIDVHGPIPEGTNIDHTCHNADLTCPGNKLCEHRRCCNPRHLEAVQQLVNVRRARRRVVAAIASSTVAVLPTRFAPFVPKPPPKYPRLHVRESGNWTPKRRPSLQTIERIRDALTDGALSARRITERSGLTEGSVRKTLAWMEAHKLVHRSRSVPPVEFRLL